MPAAQMTGSFGGRVFLLELEDPGVGLVGDLREEQKIVTGEGRGALPLVAVFVENPVTGHPFPNVHGHRMERERVRELGNG